MKLRPNVFTSILLAHILFSFVSLDALQAEEFHVTTAAEFQNALTVARDNGQADTILLAAGAYNTSENDYVFTYIAKEGEDYALNIKGEVGTTAEDVILDGNNEYEVLSIEQGSATVTIEGITVQNGIEGISISSSGDIILINNTITENIETHVRGGAVNISSSHDITLTGNTIANNEGSGLYASSSQIGPHLGNINLSNNIIIGNASGGVCILWSGKVILHNNTIAGNIGAGVDITYTDDIAVTDNIIAENSGIGVGVFETGNIILTNNTITENRDGGVEAASSGNITLANNIITENTADYSAGGVEASSFSGDIILTNNIITGNTAGIGGGVYIYVNSYASCSDCSTENITLTNNTITGNTANVGSGGGVYLYVGSYYPSSGDIILTNNTIATNEASQNAGGLYLSCQYEDNIANIYNNIIWGNKSIEGEDIYNDSYIYAVTNFHNNNFHDIAGSPFTEDVNSIDDDPLFANPEQQDYRLLPDSPCIDKGTADAPELPSTDFEGESRIIGVIRVHKTNQNEGLKTYHQVQKAH